MYESPPSVWQDQAQCPTHSRYYLISVWWTNEWIICGTVGHTEEVGSST